MRCSEASQGLTKWRWPGPKIIEQHWKLNYRQIRERMCIWIVRITNAYPPNSRHFGVPKKHSKSWTSYAPTVMDHWMLHPHLQQLLLNTVLVEQKKILSHQWIYSLATIWHYKLSDVQRLQGRRRNNQTWVLSLNCSRRPL